MPVKGKEEFSTKKMEDQKKDIQKISEEIDQSAEGVPGEELSREDVMDNEADEVDHESEEDRLKGIFEALLFLSNEPLPVTFFTKEFGLDPTQTKILIDSLVDEYEERDGGIKLAEISNGFQFITSKKYADQVRRVMGFKKTDTLSRGMLETLSIIAYRQPIMLAEIEELRGVSSRMMVANLMKKNLVKPAGRKELPGRPLTYGTTDEFLRYFGLNKLSDLPKLSEIKEFSFGDEEQDGR